MFLSPPGIGLPVANAKGLTLCPLAPAGFNPNQVSGLVAALYGTNLTGADGDPIFSWLDPDAGSHYADTGPPIGLPVKKDGILNGLPVARFNGNHLGNSGIITNSQEFSMFLVYNQTTGGSDQHIFINGDAGSSGYGVYLRGSDSAPFLLFGGVTQQSVDTPSGWGIIGLRYSAGTLNGRVSGHAGFGTSMTGPHVPTNNSVVGSADDSGLQFYVGDIFSVLLYDNDIGTTNFGKVMDYLSALTAIPL